MVSSSAFLPLVCGPALCAVGFRFRMFQRYLALWPAEVGRVYRLLEWLVKVVLGVDIFTYSLLVLPRLVLGGS